MKYILGVFFFLPTLVLCQSWARTYENGYGHSVQQTVDGGYIVTGSTNINTYGYNIDVYLLKTNSEGDVLWSKTFGGNLEDGGLSVQQTSDGGYIIAGINTSFNGINTYLLKTDNNGDTTWTRTFFEIGSNIAISVQQTTDGGYIICGYSNSFSNGDNDAYLLKTDNNGDLLWIKNYGGQSLDKSYSAQQTADDGYIITGCTSSFDSGICNGYLIKTNCLGDTLWTKTLGSSNEKNEGFFVQQTNDEGYIITGYIETENNDLDVYLVKTDNNGNLLWTKTFGGEKSDSGHTVKQTYDGGYIIVGNSESESNDFDIYLIKTDNNGNALWTKTFGGKNRDVGYSVQQTEDGGYIITGECYINSKSYLILIKTDNEGNISSEAEYPFLNPNKELIKIVDFSGKEISNPKSNVPFIEIYNDGTTQKKMVLE